MGNRVIMSDYGLLNEDAYIHSDKSANVLWLDGHAESKQEQEFTKYSTSIWERLVILNGESL